MERWSGHGRGVGSGSKRTRAGGRTLALLKMRRYRQKNAGDALKMRPELGERRGTRNCCAGGVGFDAPDTHEHQRALREASR